MRKSIDIRYLPTAEKDLMEIFEYIKKDNPAAAASELDKFDRAISRLSRTPSLGLIPRDRRLRAMGYRMFVVDKYLVFYVVKKKFIQVRRVIHGARRYSFLL